MEKRVVVGFILVLFLTMAISCGLLDSVGENVRNEIIGISLSELQTTVDSVISATIEVEVRQATQVFYDPDGAGPMTEMEARANVGVPEVQFQYDFDVPGQFTGVAWLASGIPDTRHNGMQAQVVSVLLPDDPTSDEFPDIAGAWVKDGDVKDLP